MKCSVLLFSFNQESYIEECLESILMQRFNGEIELVVAEDCSTDKTLERIKDCLSASSIQSKILNRAKI